MKTKHGWPIAVCSWSLQQNLPGVAASLQRLGVSHIHLAVAPVMGKGGAAYLEFAREQSWTITSAMIAFPQEDYSTLDSIRRTGGVVPDNTWPGNQQLFLRAADAAAQLNTPYLSMHAGFLEPGNRVFIERIEQLADAAGERNLTLLLETGQESAAELRRFLEELDHPALGLNFDPANMILYDKDDPVTAVALLGPWIRHVHMKDAVRTKTPGQWCAEVPWGDGEVGGAKFLTALAATGYRGPVAIEREAGNARFADIEKAVRRLTV